MNFLALWFGGGTLFILFLWLKELWFYKKRNWDFSVDSGISQSGPGDAGLPIRQDPPKIRVLIVAPLMIVMGLCLTIFAQVTGAGE